MWPVSISMQGTDEPTLVEDIKILWKEPTGAFTDNDTVDKFVITLKQGDTTLVVEGSATGNSKTQPSRVDKRTKWIMMLIW